jgi:hypothetical protein
LQCIVHESKVLPGLAIIQMRLGATSCEDLSPWYHLGRCPTVDRYRMRSVTTHKTNQATKPKHQLGTKENTQHHPAPTARAKSRQARYSAHQSSVGLARQGRKHAPLDLANIPTDARYRK